MTKETNTGKEIRSLRHEAKQLARLAKAARKIKQPKPPTAETSIMQAERQKAQLEADRLTMLEDQARREADRLKATGAARLENLTVYTVDKVRGKKTYTYWYASWKCGKDSHTVYLGSAKRIDRTSAQAKARELKAEDLRKMGYKC